MYTRRILRTVIVTNCVSYYTIRRIVKVNVLVARNFYRIEKRVRIYGWENGRAIRIAGVLNSPAFGTIS